MIFAIIGFVFNCLVAYLLIAVGISVIFGITSNLFYKK